MHACSWRASMLQTTSVTELFLHSIQANMLHTLSTGSNTKTAVEVSNAYAVTQLACVVWHAGFSPALSALWTCFRCPQPSVSSSLVGRPIAQPGIAQKPSIQPEAAEISTHDVTYSSGMQTQGLLKGRGICLLVHLQSVSVRLYCSPLVCYL